MNPDTLKLVFLVLETVGIIAALVMIPTLLRARRKQKALEQQIRRTMADMDAEVARFARITRYVIRGEPIEPQDMQWYLDRSKDRAHIEAGRTLH